MENMELKIGNRPVKLMKSHINPDFIGRTVLSDSNYEYVELWLRNQKGDNFKKALFYWQQSRSFYKASESLPIEAKPLTAYYSILNATKSLLVIHGIDVVGIGHGVSSSRQDITGKFRKDEIKFAATGALCKLSGLLEEQTAEMKYTVYDLLYNLPCVHRTFSITYKDATDLFMPVSHISFELTNEKDVTKRDVYIKFLLDKRYDTATLRKSIPTRCKYVIPPARKGNPYYRIKILRQHTYRVCYI